MRVAATPFDGEMQKLNAALVGTAIGYGSGRGEVARKIATATAMPASAAADRAGYFGVKGGAVGGGGDLVDEVTTGKVKLADLKRDALDSSSPAWTKPTAKTTCKQKAAERTKIQEQINAVARQRKAWLKKQRQGQARLVRRAGRRRAQEAGEVDRSRSVASAASASSASGRIASSTSGATGPVDTNHS